MPDTEPSKGWCVLELMGHRKLAGWISDDAGLVRVDVYLQDPGIDRPQVRPIATQWYGQAAIYCITATTKANCLALTKSHQPQPIGRWELPERAGLDDADRAGEDELDDAEFYE